ncbi:hypothetical protein [Streptomyces sp. NPDC049881]|uniref:hypothetical protein n=1 Tax=Streptomyces sp. NPDC049881 TaxID=3155778 RepID=UPI0034177D1A
MSPRHLTAAMAVVVAVGTLTACGGGHGRQSVLFPASERPESRSPAPTGAVPLAELTDGEEILARANRAAAQLASARMEMEGTLDGEPFLSMGLRGDQDGSCAALMTAETQSMQFRQHAEDLWVQFNAEMLSESGGPEELAGTWLHAPADDAGSELAAFAELCDDPEGFLPVIEVPGNATAMTVTPSDDGGHVEVSWNQAQDGVEGTNTVRITADGTDLLVRTETIAEVPGGTVRYLASWSEFDEPVGITPPDPGSVVEFDDLAEELGDLPYFGEGIIPAAYTDEPG